MEQKILSNIESELKELGDQKKIEQLPSLKLEEGKIAEIEISFEKPFEKWQDPQSKAVKKIIHCVHNDQRCIFWLNVANPLYRELLEAGKSGRTKFKILRTGSAKATRYTLIKE